jgi:uncharacterized coiled-coil protein SlyX
MMKTLEERVAQLEVNIAMLAETMEKLAAASGKASEIIEQLSRLMLRSTDNSLALLDIAEYIDERVKKLESPTH